ncbi:hypothetical protein BGW80DRAFT_257340 [Lactifluus volemus]|nr:hypothetical protein BGW80DRAFT_257340 [Lactifluus volemus]
MLRAVEKTGLRFEISALEDLLKEAQYPPQASSGRFRKPSLIYQSFLYLTDQKVMVPPRAGNDFYSNEELDVMLDVPRTRIAFDMTSSAIDAFDQIRTIQGVTRTLTSRQS